MPARGSSLKKKLGYYDFGWINDVSQWVCTLSILIAQELMYKRTHYLLTMTFKGTMYIRVKDSANNPLLTLLEDVM
jgi:hypothetical protein